MVGLPATATEANFTPIISKMASSKSQFYFSDSVFPTFLEAKAEAAAQGVSSKVLWVCQTTCYDARVRQGRRRRRGRHQGRDRHAAVQRGAT